MTISMVWAAPPAFAPLGRLPIRLRAQDGEVVASGVSGSPMAAPVGRYFLCVTLPNGREIIGGTPIEVGESGIGQLPTLEREMARSFDIATLAAAAKGHQADTHANVTIHRWDGVLADIWTDGAVTLELGDPVEIGPMMRGVAHGRQIDTALLLPTPKGLIAHILPYDRPLDPAATGNRDILVAPTAKADRLTFKTPLSDAANAFFLYVENGLLAEAKRLSLALVTDPAPPASMLQAVLAIYVLLRANELSLVDPSLDRLLALAPDMPDTYAVCAEVRARQGRHEEAVTALRTGCELGCPWFRSGVSYLLERLRLYLEIDEGPSTFSLRADDRDRGRAWKAGLERIAVRLDMAAMFTAFHVDKPLQFRRARTGVHGSA